MVLKTRKKSLFFYLIGLFLIISLLYMSLGNFKRHDTYSNKNVSLNSNLKTTKDTNKEKDKNLKSSEQINVNDNEQIKLNSNIKNTKPTYIKNSKSTTSTTLNTTNKNIPKKNNIDKNLTEKTSKLTVAPASKVPANKSNNVSTTISDKEFKNLISKAYVAMRNIENFYPNATIIKHTDGNYYAKLPERITDQNSLVKYINKTLHLNSYYTDDYVQRFLNYSFKQKINGEYYILVGQFGQILDTKNIKITSKEYKNNKLYVTYEGKYEPTIWTKERATLIYDGSKWLINNISFSPW